MAAEATRARRAMQEIYRDHSTTKGRSRAANFFRQAMLHEFDRRPLPQLRVFKVEMILS